MRERTEPERRCIVTGESGPKGPLVRFVVGPDSRLVPDLAERLPGRGIWVTAAAEPLERAARRNLFAKAARGKVEVPEDLAGLVARLSAARLVELLALARKAGLAIAGHDKVKARLSRGPVAALVEASDGSEQGRARLRPLAGDAPRIACLTGAELGLAFGRERVIHAALEAGGITDRVLREAERLGGLRRAASPMGRAGPEGAGPAAT